MEEEARVLIRTKMERFLAHMNSNKKSLFTAEYQAVRIALPNNELAPHASHHNLSHMCVASCLWNQAGRRGER